MSLDLITAIELTASAAIVVTFASTVLTQNSRSRLQLAAVFTAWFAIVGWLGATHALGSNPRTGSAALGLTVFLPIALLWYGFNRIASFRSALAEVPLSWLVGINLLRVLGLSFLLLKAVGRVAPTFATTAGWGDIAVGVLALPVAWLTAVRGTRLRPALLAWNSLGLLDLVVAVTLGVGSSPGPQRFIFESANSAIMATLPWLYIPAFLVPLFALSHVAIFWRLKNRRAEVVTDVVGQAPCLATPHS